MPRVSSLSVLSARSFGWASGGPLVSVDYYVLGGGSGASGGTFAIGYGAGGASGVLREAENLLLPINTAFNIRVGAGGAGTGQTPSGAGTSSILANITATGGNSSSNSSLTGASNADFSGGAGDAPSGRSGGGAGSAANGGNATSAELGGGVGGAGVISTFTGSPVQLGGGGGGGKGGAGGAGGGGPAASSDNARGEDAAVNSGSGGGGGPGNEEGGGPGGGNGGSGYIMLKTTPGTIVTFSGGVTYTTGTVGGKNIYFVTATSTTSETVTFSR